MEACYLDPLEPAGFSILSHVTGGKDASIHGDVDPGFLALQSPYGTSDIKLGIGRLEASRCHGARQNDCLVS